MNFGAFKKKFQQNFANISKGSTKLFEVEVDKDEMWDLYQDSFPEGTNPIFRKRREYDCSCCKSFMRNFGGVVVIDGNERKSIWDFETGDTTFDPVAKALSDYIKSKPISGVYISKTAKIGTDKSKEMTEDAKLLTWEHFHLTLPEAFITKGDKSEGHYRGEFFSRREVLKNSLEQISETSILTVLELIAGGTLYRGNENKSALEAFLPHIKAYKGLTNEQKELYTWHT